MRAWHTDMRNAPLGIPVLLRMIEAPIGWSAPCDGVRATVMLGQRGDADTGFWTDKGLFLDNPPKGQIGASIFSAWAHVPPFDAEGAAA